jgi:tRNA(fMet)-specific endonuclease VapC
MGLRYLLDTNICIYIREKKPVKVLGHFNRLESGDLAMSVITFGELAYGTIRHPHPANAMSSLERLAELIPVLPLPEGAGRAYGELRALLAAKGAAIGPNDLWIAAHALAADLILVTNNEREFRRVKGLKIENWTK